jgi:hypothetical protein
MRDATPWRSPLLVRNFKVEDDDRPLRLNTPHLLSVLRTMRSIGTTSLLRHAVDDLRAQVNDARSAIHAGPRGEATEFASGYLDQELDQIAASQTLERAHYYVDRLIRGVSEVRTSAINDINLNRWKEYDDIHLESLWFVGHRDGSGAHSAEYWGNFIPQIPHQMMRRYTKRGEWVLDVFTGMGTTLIEGQRLGRNTLGIELQPSVARRARSIVREEENPHDVVSKLVTGDGATRKLTGVLRANGTESVQLVIMHPPYFDIIKFSDDERDLSNAPSVESFLDRMGRVVDNVTPLHDTGRYLVLVIGDKYANGEWVPLGFMTMNEVLKRGYGLKSIIVKNFEQTAGKRGQKELWKYRALAGGFYLFKHEYIFVFRKNR